MTEAVNAFRLEGRPVRCITHGMGHINRSFLITTDAPHRYFLQRISRTAFHDIPAMMENIAAVTEFLAGRAEAPRSFLHLVPTWEGGSFYLDDAGEYWRVYEFVEGSLCLQQAESPEDVYQSAAAFGAFQKKLRGFPISVLHETIPGFHNTPERYRQFDEARARDCAGRAGNAAGEIEFALSRRKDAAVLQKLLEEGTLPLRVTHNDTKLTNVLFDSGSRKALCVIDLDTVMPGLAAYDFGDGIRAGASTAAEDERDMDRISLDLDLFRAFADGFISACGGLDEAETASLPWGARLMTLECGVRFLTDYLNGDIYFATAYEEHNLVRARNQFRLVREMEEKWEKMCEAVFLCGITHKA